jgi:hypothetical protein
LSCAEFCDRAPIHPVFPGTVPFFYTNVPS